MSGIEETPKPKKKIKRKKSRRRAAPNTDIALDGGEKVRMGRPTLLTKEVQEEITEYLRAGVPSKYASRTCRISDEVFMKWMREGATARKGSALRRFYEAAEQAKAENVTRNVQIIANAALESPQWAAWVLERVARDEFGPRPVAESGTQVIQIGVHIERQVIVASPVTAQAHSHTQHGLVQKDVTIELPALPAGK